MGFGGWTIRFQSQSRCQVPPSFFGFGLGLNFRLELGIGLVNHIREMISIWKSVLGTLFMKLFFELWKRIYIFICIQDFVMEVSEILSLKSYLTKSFLGFYSIHHSFSLGTKLEIIDNKPESKSQRRGSLLTQSTVGWADLNETRERSRQLQLKRVELDLL